MPEAADTDWPGVSPRADFLAGCRVLELSSRAAGAYAGRLLALLGAEVTRVDLPTAFDCRPDELAAVRSSMDEHKTTIRLRDAALAIGSCDVVISDCTKDDATGGTARAAVEALLAELPPNTHVVEIPAHGDDARPAGTSLTACAEGAMSWAIGDPGDRPLTLPFDIPDYLAGTEAAATAALALLTSVQRPGQRWSVAVSDVISNYVGQISSNFVAYERPWHRDGARATMSGGSYPAAMFQCEDGWVSVMCRTQVEWHGLVAALDRPEWLADERYRDARVVARHHADELDPIVTEWCRSLSRAEVFEAGRRHGFPVAPVLTVPEAMREEQLLHRAFFVKGPSGSLIPGSPYRVTDPAATERPARVPRLTPAADDRPLAGLRVLDLAWVWSGPMVTASLADLGAEVIKVESRARPDPSRMRGRAYRDGEPLAGPELEVTPYHNQMNRGKRSVEIDITTEEGAALVRRLAAECDVVVENMRPGVLARRGLDYAGLSKDHPALVMVSLSMLGQTGPLSGIRGYAVVMSGLAGLDSLIGYGPDRLIGTFNPALGDPNGAAHGLAVVLAALRRSLREGRGAWIDVSQVEALLSILQVPVHRAQVEGRVLPPANGHATWWPHGVYRCAGDDGWVALACRNDDERARLTSWCGSAQDELEATLERMLAALPPGRVVAELAVLRIPVAPVATYESMRAGGRDVFDLVSHRWLGEQPLFGIEWRQDGQRLRVERPAPLLGADTDAVLTGVLGMSANDVAGLRAAGIVGGAS
ncbi:CoA transferase [Acrocarpospora pleiomorpha]|uniref:CoA transferase n=1 Tax=Acrocarpospora pleiomorpha TaxID=90975 RepID=A0A5M3XGS7_9ACTN|nr:CoA transferase [Acrocarpospora pleiomorpha]GES19359.1 CoA transferase [Acrocarpospora pleiomorpha]